MNQIKQLTSLNELDNENRINAIINFWKNMNPKKLKADLEKNHNEMLHIKLRNKKHSTKILDLLMKLKNEIGTNELNKPLLSLMELLQIELEIYFLNENDDLYQTTYVYLANILQNFMNPLPVLEYAVECYNSRSNENDCGDSLSRYGLRTDERLIKNLSEKLNEMIESKAQLQKKLAALQKELDVYKNQKNQNQRLYFHSNSISPDIRNDFQAHLEINDYSSSNTKTPMPQQPRISKIETLERHDRHLILPHGTVYVENDNHNRLQIVNDNRYMIPTQRSNSYLEQRAPSREQRLELNYETKHESTENEEIADNNNNIGNTNNNDVAVKFQNSTNPQRTPSSITPHCSQLKSLGGGTRLNTKFISHRIQSFLRKNQIHKKYFCHKILGTSILLFENLVEKPKDWSKLNSMFKLYFKKMNSFINNVNEQKSFIEHVKSKENKESQFDEKNDLIRYDISQITIDDEMDTKLITSNLKKKLYDNRLNQKILCEAVLDIPLSTMSSFCSKSKKWKELSERTKEPFMRMYAWLNDPEGVKKLNEWKEKNCRKIVKITRRIRRCYTKFQEDVLLKEFEKNCHPCKNKITELSKIVNLSEKATMKWFTNRRYKFRHLYKDTGSSKNYDSVDSSSNTSEPIMKNNESQQQSINENNNNLVRDDIFYEIID